MRHYNVIYISVILILCSCGSRISTKQNGGNRDTSMLAYPALVFTNDGQTRMQIQDPNNKKAISSFGSSDFLTVRVDEMAKEIIIEPSKFGKKEFYASYADWMSVNVKRFYAEKQYKFFWIDSNNIQRRLRVIIEPTFQPDNTNILDTNTEKVLTRSQFGFFMKKLKYSPKDYYSKFLIKDAVPKFNGDYKGIENKTLNMDDYYAIFQKGYPFSYPGVHPYYFLSYKEYSDFTQFFIYHFHEDWGNSIYLIHLNDSGKKVFECEIWSSGGDGGDYYKTSNSTVSESSVEYTGETGYWYDNPDKPEYKKTTQFKYFFDKFGVVRKKQETETIEGAYPFEIYDPFEWFPDEDEK